MCPRRSKIKWRICLLSCGHRRFGGDFVCFVANFPVCQSAVTRRPGGDNEKVVDKNCDFYPPPLFNQPPSHLRDSPWGHEERFPRNPFCRAATNPAIFSHLPSAGYSSDTNALDASSIASTGLSVVMRLTPFSIKPSISLVLFTVQTLIVIPRLLASLIHSSVSLL